MGRKERRKLSRKSDEMAEEGSNKLRILQATEGKRYREMMGEQDRTVRVCHLSEVWGGGKDSGSRCVPVQENQESEGRKGKEGVGREGRNEVGQLGCATIKEVDENGGKWQC